MWIFSVIEIDEGNGEFYTITEHNTKYKFSAGIGRKINLYSKWDEFITIITNDIDDKKMLNPKPSQTFISEFNGEKFHEILLELFQLDKVLKENFIPFRDSYLKANESGRAQTFYRILVKCFFRTDEAPQQITYKGDRNRYYSNVSLEDLSDCTINLLYDRIPEITL